MKFNYKVCVVVVGCGVGVGYLLGGFIPRDEVKSPEETTEEAKTLPFSNKDYSFGYWQNGYRKHKGDTSKDILCLETGYFGLTLDMAQLDKIKFGRIKDELDYAGALAANGSRMSELKNAVLSIELEKDGKVYRAVSCRAAKERAEGSRFLGTRLWESARYVQNFEIQGLEFKSADGETLVTDSALRVIAWPNSLSLTVKVAPAVAPKTGPEVKHPVWENTKMSIRLKDSNNNWYAEKHVAEKWTVGTHKKVTVNCNLVSSKKDDTKVTTKISVAMKLNKLPPVVYDKEFNGYVARVNRPKRDWKGGYNENRNYDDIDITIDSHEEKTIPFLLEMFNPASITGLCPILCDENGVPTGIPVQLSKNWHYREMGAYLRAYALLPTIKGQKKYKLRIIYGFYGKVPSASHAQLSLVGYGGNGRWDQLSIGAWGETYCMDMDMSCVDVAVTDVRMLMARNGLKGEKWRWTEAGWGGDWLGLKDTNGKKHLFNGIKTAYLSHGPCLTEAKYDGYYGTQREVDFSTTVRTLRTDDHARTFTTMKYVFDKSVKADGWIFKMGRTRDYVTPKIAYGNGAGLIKEHQVPNGLKIGAKFIPKTTLTGAGPWWVTFPGAYTEGGKDWGTGYRAMVIRSFKANIGGKEYTNPTIAFPAFQSAGEGKPNLDFLMTAPEGVTDFNPGDTIEFNVEWITLPRVAADYYGPNETFRKHVAENPSSWKTTYREAIGNNLKVSVNGGTLLNNYPIIIQTDKQEVTVDIDGGVGFVPIRFEGLKQAKGYALYQVIDGKEVKLDQSVHGNDFWQTDYDVKTNRFKMTFNLLLDGLKASKWILKST